MLILVGEVAVAAIMVWVYLTAEKPAARVPLHGNVAASWRRLNVDKFPWETMRRPGKDQPSTHETPSDNPDPSSDYYDNSRFYSTLRQAYEGYFPRNQPSRFLQMVGDMQKYRLGTHHSPGYDILNCPDHPPPGYPMEWNLLGDILAKWPADDPEVPASSKIYNGLCLFDYKKDYDKAIRYRNAEVPFVIRGDPAVAETVVRWNTPHYIEALLGDVPQPAEISDSSQFLYWNTGSGWTPRAAEWKPPTQHIKMTYSEWKDKASLTEYNPQAPHYYFKVVGCSAAGPSAGRTSSCSAASEVVPYLADELPFYTQAHTSLYIKDPARGGAATKLINCRFGMKGVIAANHFDGDRNFVTVLSGERRYILANPNQCNNMALFPPGHPSSRHSMVDWCNPDVTKYPQFEHAKANEVVLQAGDSLFLPALWFHFIVSLSSNVQCNTRSGMDSKHDADIDACGY